MPYHGFGYSNHTLNVDESCVPLLTVPEYPSALCSAGWHSTGSPVWQPWPVNPEYDSLDSKQKCSAIVRKISHSEEQAAYGLIAADWANCVWASEAQKIEPYPKAQWEKFLKTQDLTEVVKEEVPE